MNFEEVKQKIEHWLQPLLPEKNIFLVDIKIAHGRRIEVYLDTDEGIHIDDCATVSRFLEKHLDGSGIVPENYILEVSSPGMTNPLKVPRQYKRRIGRKLEVLKTNGEMLIAQLTEADDAGIKLLEIVEEKKKKKSTEPLPAPKETVLAYTDIKRATLVF